MLLLKAPSSLLSGHCCHLVSFFPLMVPSQSPALVPPCLPPSASTLVPLPCHTQCGRPHGTRTPGTTQITWLRLPSPAASQTSPPGRPSGASTSPRETPFAQISPLAFPKPGGCSRHWASPWAPGHVSLVTQPAVST